MLQSCWPQLACPCAERPAPAALPQDARLQQQPGSAPSSADAAGLLQCAWEQQQRQLGQAPPQAWQAAPGPAQGQAWWDGGGRGAQAGQASQSAQPGGGPQLQQQLQQQRAEQQQWVEAAQQMLAHSGYPQAPQRWPGR